MTSEKYHPSLRALHWLMFVLSTTLFVLGAVMIEFKVCCKPWTMYDLHKSTGVVVFLLVLIRMLVRWQTSIPAPLINIHAIPQRIARLVILLMYVSMILVPISGYALSNLYGHQVKLYGLPLPTLFPAVPAWQDFSSSAHFVLAYFFLTCIALHLTGVIMHHLRGQELLRRIT
jgi:cytochrome b561